MEPALWGLVSPSTRIEIHTDSFVHPFRSPRSGLPFYCQLDKIRQSLHRSGGICRPWTSAHSWWIACGDGTVKLWPCCPLTPLGNFLFFCTQRGILYAGRLLNVVLQSDDKEGVRSIVKATVDYRHDTVLQDRKLDDRVPGKQWRGTLDWCPFGQPAWLYCMTAEFWRFGWERAALASFPPPHAQFFMPGCGVNEQFKHDDFEEVKVSTLLPSWFLQAPKVLHYHVLWLSQFLSYRRIQLYDSRIVKTKMAENLVLKETVLLQGSRPGIVQAAKLTVRRCWVTRRTVLALPDLSRSKACLASEYDCPVYLTGLEIVEERNEDNSCERWGRRKSQKR